jgi:hypothetical protein
MNLPVGTIKAFFLAFCISCTGWWAHNAACGQPPAKDAVVALFDGIPAELRTKVKTNSVRRDRVNDWLSENVTGKGKTIEMLMPVRVGAKRAKDGTYLVVVTVGTSPALKGGKATKGGILGGGGPAGFGVPSSTKLTLLGDDWSLDLNLGGKDSAELIMPNLLELAGVSGADAEKLCDLTEATVKGKIHELKLVGETYLRLVLSDVQVDGKKMTPRKREPGPQGVQPPTSAK